MIDFDDDFDVDTDDSFDDDPDMDNEAKIFGEKFYRWRMNKLFKLNKMNLKNQRIKLKGENKAANTKAKRAVKLSAAIGVMSIVLRFMEDHHIDKLSEEQKRELEKLASMKGLSPSVAKAIGAMTKKQLKQSVVTNTQEFMNSVD